MRTERERTAAFFHKAFFSVKVFFIIDLVKYYMQLKYAKKYGMLDLLPSAPNEELTP